MQSDSSSQQQTQAPQQQEQQPLQKAIRILSLDGGGIRGIAVAKILQGFERKTKKKIHELFDVVVGTSTGGLLAVMMCVEVPETPEDLIEGTSEEEKELVKRRKRHVMLKKELNLNNEKVLTAKQARKLYFMKAGQIFHEEHNLWHQLTDRFKPFEYLNHWLESKYKGGDGLERTVRDLYLDNDFAHAKTCVGVVVNERNSHKTMLLNSTNAKIREHHNYHNHLSLPQLVRATSAAPTYFDPIIVRHPSSKEDNNNEKINENVKKNTDDKDINNNNKNQNENFDENCDECREKSKEERSEEILEDCLEADCEKKTLVFEDGGVTCNNPSIKAFQYARNLLQLKGHNPLEYQFQVYSIGTGAAKGEDLEFKKANEKIKGNGIYHTAFKRLILPAISDPFQIRKSSRETDIRMKRILRNFEKLGEEKIKQQYFRLQFIVDDEKDLDKLDSSDESFMRKLKRYGKEFRETKIFKEAIEALNTEVDRPKDLVNLVPIFGFLE